MRRIILEEILQTRRDGEKEKKQFKCKGKGVFKTLAMAFWKKWWNQTVIKLNFGGISVSNFSRAVLFSSIMICYSDFHTP